LDGGIGSDDALPHYRSLFLVLPCKFSRLTVGKRVEADRV
jgi:hypothetical protein